jgi:hypothetical protein
MGMEGIWNNSIINTIDRNIDGTRGSGNLHEVQVRPFQTGVGKADLPRAEHGYTTYFILKLFLIPGGGVSSDFLGSHGPP